MRSRVIIILGGGAVIKFLFQNTGCGQEKKEGAEENLMKASEDSQVYLCLLVYIEIVLFYYRYNISLPFMFNVVPVHSIWHHSSVTHQWFINNAVMVEKNWKKMKKSINLTTSTNEGTNNHGNTMKFLTESV